MDRMLEEGTADTQGGGEPSNSRQESAGSGTAERVQENSCQTEEVMGRFLGRDDIQGFIETGPRGLGPKVGRTCVVIEVEDRELVCLDGEVEQELERMQGGLLANPKDSPPASVDSSLQKSRKIGRTSHPCPYVGCDFVGRSVTVLR